MTTASIIRHDWACHVCERDFRSALLHLQELVAVEAVSLYTTRPAALRDLHALVARIREGRGADRRRAVASLLAFANRPSSAPRDATVAALLRSTAEWVQRALAELEAAEAERLR